MDFYEFEASLIYIMNSRTARTLSKTEQTKPNQTKPNQTKPNKTKEHPLLKSVARCLELLAQLLPEAVSLLQKAPELLLH